MKVKKIFSLKLFYPIFLLIFLFFVSYLLAQTFQEPTLPPPQGNVEPPLTTSSQPQTKKGNLSLANLFLNAISSEGSIFNLDKLIGFNDLFLKSNQDENSPIYYGASEHKFYVGKQERLDINQRGVNFRLGESVGMRLENSPTKSLAECTPDNLGYVYYNSETDKVCVCKKKGWDCGIAIPSGNIKLVFVTSTLYTGDLKTHGNGSDGVEGANNICQERANAACLQDPSSPLCGRTFKAWISTPSVPAVVNIQCSNFKKYVRPDGKVVAENCDDLIDGNIQNPINVTEYLNILPAFKVFTATDYKGTYYTDFNCNNWTSINGNAAVGDTSSTSTSPVCGTGRGGGPGWTMGCTGGSWTTRRDVLRCQDLAPIYCFEI